MKQTERIHQLLEHFTDIGPPGCALSVSVGGETIYEDYVGYADIESKKLLGPDSLFRLYSSTKVVTAVAFMILLERGQVLLDDPVQKYLPEFAHPAYVCYTGNNIESYRPAGELTIKHLLTMTAGFTYDGKGGTVREKTALAFEELERKGGFTLREFSWKIAEIPLAFEPGSSWHYGVCLDVLGAVIEVISGKSFGQFLREEILTPLGMNSTYFFCPSNRREDLTTAYRRTDGMLIPDTSLDYRLEESYLFESGGGGLVSTLRDMAVFVQMLSMGGTLGGVRILGRKTIELMCRNHLTPGQLEDFQKTHRNGWKFMAGYGYGLGVKTLLNPAASNCSGSVGEFGWAGMAGTLLLADPSEKLAVAYMQQLMPDNLEGYCHPRLRNMVYSLLA